MEGTENIATKIKMNRNNHSQRKSISKRKSLSLAVFTQPIHMENIKSDLTTSGAIPTQIRKRIVTTSELLPKPASEERNGVDIMK